MWWGKLQLVFWELRIQDKTFYKCKNVSLTINRMILYLQRTNLHTTGVVLQLNTPGSMEKIHFGAIVVLLGPVCLFWHEILSHWRFGLDPPPRADRQGWVVIIKNITPSSCKRSHGCAEDAQKYCSHTERDLWHRPYITRAGYESSVNTTAPLSSGWLPFRSRDQEGDSETNCAIECFSALGEPLILAQRSALVRWIISTCMFYLF